jgi:hypothetical protein
LETVLIEASHRNSNKSYERMEMEKCLDKLEILTEDKVEFPRQKN